MQACCSAHRTQERITAQTTGLQLTVLETSHDLVCLTLLMKFTVWLWSKIVRMGSIMLCQTVECILL